MRQNLNISIEILVVPGDEKTSKIRKMMTEMQNFLNPGTSLRVSVASFAASTVVFYFQALKLDRGFHALVVISWHYTFVTLDERTYVFNRISSFRVI